MTTTCEYCESDFKNQASLRSHKAQNCTEVPEEHECPACGSGFETKYGLGQHLAQYCDDATAAQRQEGREFQSGEDHPHYGKEGPLKGRTGEDHPMYGVTFEMSEERKRKIVENREYTEEGREALRESMRGETNPMKDPQIAARVTRKNYENGVYDGSTVGIGTVDWYDVDGLDGKVHGRLEKHIGEFLVDSLDPNEIDVHVSDGFNYEVDFVIRDEIAIEAKGKLWRNGIEKGREFMERYGDEYRYIVIGQAEETQQIPSHQWIHESEMEDLLSDLIEEESQ